MAGNTIKMKDLPSSESSRVTDLIGLDRNGQSVKLPNEQNEIKTEVANIGSKVGEIIGGETVTDHSADEFVVGKAWKITNNTIDSIESASNPSSKKIATPIQLKTDDVLSVTSATYGAAINFYIITDSEGNVIANKTPTAGLTVETYTYRAVGNCLAYVNGLNGKTLSVNVTSYVEGSKIGDAPKDGEQYVRQNGAWVKKDSYSVSQSDAKFATITASNDILNSLHDDEEQIFSLNNRDWALSKKIPLKKSSSQAVISYLGKGDCTITIQGEGLQPIQLQAKNKKTGATITLLNKWTDKAQLPITFSNPRPDLELIDVVLVSGSTTVEENVTILFAKKSAIIENKENIDKAVENANTFSKYVFGTDTDDWECNIDLQLKKSAEIPVISYLGKTECTFKISGLHQQKFQVTATNSATGSRLVLYNAWDSPVQLPVTFENPRPNLQLVDVTITTASTAVEEDISVTLTKPSLIHKNKDNIDILSADITRIEKNISNSFNDDTQDWVLSKYFTLKKSSSVLLTDYLGKITCTIKVDGQSEQQFQIQATNKKTGNPINLFSSINSPVRLPVTFANPRPDLELTDVKIVTLSTAIEEPITVEIRKPSMVAENLKRIENMQYQFGAEADYNVETLTESASFVKKTPSEIYAQYDALQAMFPNYVSKIDCDQVAVDELGLTKPAQLNGYNLFLYKFTPSFTPIGVNHDGDNESRMLNVFITSGTHDEEYAIATLYNMMKHICHDWQNDKNLSDLRNNVVFWIMPLSNPWAMGQSGSGGGGVIRTNYNGVDLNRNLPTLDWKAGTVGSRDYGGESAGSEYETKIFMHYMDVIKPQIYVDFHNYGTDFVGNMAYISTRSQQVKDVANEVLTRMTRLMKKHNSNYPQDNETPLAWISNQKTSTGSRAVYAMEHVGSLACTIEVAQGSPWLNGELQNSMKDSNSAILMTERLRIFAYLILRLLKNLSV